MKTMVFLHRSHWFSRSSYQILPLSYLVLFILSLTYSGSIVKTHYHGEEANRAGGSNLIQATGQGRIVHHHGQAPSRPAKSDHNSDSSPTLILIPATPPPLERGGYNLRYSISRNLIRITYGTAHVQFTLLPLIWKYFSERIITRSHTIWANPPAQSTQYMSLEKLTLILKSKLALSCSGVAEAIHTLKGFAQHGYTGIFNGLIVNTLNAWQVLVRLYINDRT